jgi:hypothetical protein
MEKVAGFDPKELLSGQPKAAYEYGEELRRVVGPDKASLIANALFGIYPEGEHSEIAQEVSAIKKKFPGSWAYVAGGLTPDLRFPDGSTLQGA